MSGLLRAIPHHTGLFPGAKPELLIEGGTPGAEPEELDAFEAWVVEDSLNDLRPDSLFLVGLVDDHVPNSGAVDEICEHSSEPHKLIAVPGAQRHISMAKHVLGVFKRSIFRPGRLMKQLQ